MEGVLFRHTNMKLDFADDENGGNDVYADNDTAVNDDDDAGDSDSDIYQFIIHNTRKIDYYMRIWNYMYDILHG